MNIQLTSEQQMMQKMVREFAEKEITPYITSMENGEFPYDVIKKMGELGLLGIPIDGKYGGSNMDFMSYIIAIHEISKISAAVGVILSVHTSVGTNPIIYFGTEEQKEKYVPKLATGQYLGAFALTEPSAGSDAMNVKTSARKEGDAYVLNGSKVFITNGLEADTFIVFTRTGAEKSSKSLTAFIVERDTEGLIIGKSEKKMGLHGTSTVTLTFDQCRVNEANRLGNEGDGFKIAMANLNIGRIGIAAQALGIAEGALSHARTYAKERTQFGTPIAHHQGISFKLADMHTAVEATRLLVYRAASLIEAEIECAKEVSMAKLMAAQTARQVTIEAVQILGGYGYTKDYPVERYFRDAKVTEIYEGTNEIQKMVIAKRL
ncbi:MAG TPA: acyl-CoA dehydrogenase [Candidatus Pseudogracilibacillus intestinigallinarum]|uniref:Acyl-CoA dehydrogenase n=1 Tax=Candidatus Pseudogracilibacillus intestinigallinarum TaxID=2838742 RepID=A0A9D1PLG1_9BACI|nr:acyl-CoA dehydrogenase [Candidatus Pseudogracilibacillus intestinigallinarum]